MGGPARRSPTRAAPLSSQPALDSTSAQQVQATLYANAKTGDFHDITTGSSTGSPNYSAGAGYDYVTGLGTPVANLVIQSLDGTVTAPPTDHLVISAPTTDDRRRRDSA